MVRNCKRKTPRQSWSVNAMSQAISAVAEMKMGYRKAAVTFGVPQSILEGKIPRKRKNPNIKESSKVNIGKKKIFNVKEEEELLSYFKFMENRLFGLSTSDFKKLAFELAIRNNKNNSFNQDKRQARKEGLRLFLKQCPNISPDKPEAKSTIQETGFNKVSVTKFFDLLCSLMDKYELSADKIFNCDERVILIVSKLTSKIITAKEKEQMDISSSAERGKTVTVQICFNAAGRYMSPMLIFPRKKMRVELMNEAPPGAWAEVHPSGLMQREIFENWFQKFIEFSHASKDNRILLLLDSDTLHTQNLNIIKMARENGVILLCFPLQCTHHLQPLSVAFIKPLTTYYEQEIKNWLQSHPGRAVTTFQIAEIFGKAYIQAATMSTAKNGFSLTGIWPSNPHMFNDAVFNTETTTRNISVESHHISDDSNNNSRCVTPEPHNISENGLTVDSISNQPSCSTQNIEDLRTPINSSMSTILTDSLVGNESHKRKITEMQNETNENFPSSLNDNYININIAESHNRSMIRTVTVDPHISRLFDNIRYSEEAVSVLPNRSWAIHCTDVPVKRIVISEMMMHNAHGRGLEPFYVKQIIFDEKLNFELFLLNSRKLLKDKPSCVKSMGDFESVLDYVDSIKLCRGGPDISEYSNVNPECAYKDPYNKWRHNLCLLEIHDCDVCELCVSLEEILKRHAQRKPLKSRNTNVVKRKRTCL